MVNSEQLQHHGIPKQKWGQRNGPPYPLKPSARSSAEKKAASSSGSRGSSVAKYKAALIKKRQMAEIKKTEKAKTDEEIKAEQKKKTKEKVMKSNSIAEVYKHADLFSDQELQQMKTHYLLEKDIKELAKSEKVNKGKNFVEKIGLTGDALGKIATVIDNGSRTYNNVAKVMNFSYIVICLFLIHI